MAATFFRTSRNIELSLVKDLKTALATSWDAITVTKGFPNFAKATTLPIVSVRLLNKNRINREVGSRSDTGSSEYNIMLDIFALNEGQRLDLVDTLEDIIIANFDYYLHSRPSGGGATIDTTLAGKIAFTRFLQNTKIDFSEEVENYDRFRHALNFIAKVSVSDSDDSVSVTYPPTFTLSDSVTNGDLVCISAAYTLDLANCTNAARRAIGVMKNLSTRQLKTSGLVLTVNTEGSGNILSGNDLFLSVTPGKVTKTPPQSGAVFVQEIGTAVTNESAGLVDIILFPKTPSDIG